MLFWSFILAFVLSLLYYMSPVHNVVQVEDKPLADTMVATFVNAHQAAKRMMYTDMAGTKTVNKQCDGVSPEGKPIKVDCQDEDGLPIPIQVEDTSKRTITFTYKKAMKSANKAPCAEKEPQCIFDEVKEGIVPINAQYSHGGLAIINPSEIKKMLHGVTETAFYDYNITSAVACISNLANEKDEKGNYKNTVPYLTFDCKGGKGNGVGDYVITYMQAPTEEHSIIARNELWRSGVLRRTKGSHECGVLWETKNGELSLMVNNYQDGKIIEKSQNIQVDARKKYDKDSPYILDNSRRFTVSVPKVIGEQLAKDVALRSDMKSGYLLFCITPIDDIKASFEWKNKNGYGIYQITDSTTKTK